MTTAPKLVQSNNDLSKTGNGNNSSSTSIVSSTKPMPPKPPPRLDIREEQHISHKNSNLNFTLNSVSAEKMIGLVNNPSAGKSDRNFTSVQVTSIKYNDKYVHDNENRLVKMTSRSQIDEYRNCKFTFYLCDGF